MKLPISNESFPGSGKGVAQNVDHANALLTNAEEKILEVYEELRLAGVYEFPSSPRNVDYKMIEPLHKAIELVEWYNIRSDWLIHNVRDDLTEKEKAEADALRKMDKRHSPFSTGFGDGLGAAACVNLTVLLGQANEDEKLRDSPVTNIIDAFDKISKIPNGIVTANNLLTDTGICVPNKLQFRCNALTYYLSRRAHIEGSRLFEELVRTTNIIARHTSPD